MIRRTGPPTSQHEKKKVPIHIISFDDDDDDEETRDERKETTTSISAPATCLSSPTATSTKDSTSPCLDEVPEPQVDSNDNTVDNTKFPEWEQW